MGTAAPAADEANSAPGHENEAAGHLWAIEFAIWRRLLIHRYFQIDT